jgi:hypothetical protein
MIMTSSAAAPAVVCCLLSKERTLFLQTENDIVEVVNNKSHADWLH